MAGDGGHFAPRSGGDVVGDEGEGGGVGHGLVVADQARLGGLVVVGRDHQQSVTAAVLGHAGELYGAAGVVAPRARDNGDGTGGGGGYLHGGLEQPFLFAVGEGGGFPRGAL